LAAAGESSDKFAILSHEGGINKIRILNGKYLSCAESIGSTLSARADGFGFYSFQTRAA
jgi:hypothetical protein